MENRASGPQTLNYEAPRGDVASCVSTGADSLPSELRPSEIFLQIHAGVQTGDLVSVSVKHEGRTLEEFAQPALFRLTPAGMVHVRIHVGIETVFPRCGDIPGVQRLLFSETYAHDSLRTLESVFPRHDETDRRSILFGKILAIHAKTKQRKRMHGFVHAQPLNIRPFEYLPLLAWHLGQIQNRGELHKLRFAGRIGSLDQFAQ